MDRSELKFLVDASQRVALMEALAPHLQADRHAAPGGRYPIVNLYYDTVERDCYWEKERGIGSRRKLRVRVYGSGDVALPPASLLEIKHQCSGRGVKRRVRLGIADALRVGNGEWPAVAVDSAADVRVIEEAHALVRDRGFRPLMILRYERSAFFAGDGASELRVTFDDAIQARFERLIPHPDDRGFPPEATLYPEGTSVLEVKCAGAVPYDLARKLVSIAGAPRSHSKYARTLERMDPRLRAMREHPRAPVRQPASERPLHFAGTPTQSARYPHGSSVLHA